MRFVIAILFLSTLFSCADRQTKAPEVIANNASENESAFQISAIDAPFPLRLDEINLKDNKNEIQLNDEIISRLEETVKDYAKDFEFYDSSQSYRGTYINTIRLNDTLQTIFLVLLKHYPTNELTSRALFYDNLKKEFADVETEFKLYALYSFEKGKLIPTNLKTEFKITSPEIEVVDFNNDGVNDFKFKRLWHNGTFNATHTAILSVKDLTVDTLYFCEKGLGELAEKKSCL